MKLTLFLYVRSDAALRGRVDGEYTSIRTAFDISIHPASAFVDGLLECFGFPAVEEGGVEPIPSSVAVGEHERLLGVQSLLRELVELGGVPMDFNLDLGEDHRVRRVCTLAIGCKRDVGFMVMGIRILWRDRSMGECASKIVTRIPTFPSQQFGNVYWM